MNALHNFKFVPAQSTQKLKCWPKVVAQIYKVEMLAKSDSTNFKG
jgi:hypothetical protein